jgi:hypothetical protein
MPAYEGVASALRLRDWGLYERAEQIMAQAANYLQKLPFKEKNTAIFGDR